MGRRETLRWLGMAPWALGMPGATWTSGCADDERGLLLGPFPAMPTASSMAIWCVARHRPDEVELRSASGITLARAAFEPHVEGTFLARLSGLTADTAYTFRALDAAGRTHAGSFRTLPPPDGTLHLAIGSDIHPSSKPYVAFARIAERAPHLYLGLGDQVYADLDPERGLVGATARAHEALYLRTWDDEALRSCWSNVASLLVWDDHETFNDFDGTGDPRRAQVAREAYERMQHSRSPSDTAWTVLDAGPASLFVLDTRTFRSPIATPDGPSKTMIGAAQRDALLTWLAESQASYRVIASPTPFHRYADTGGDGWFHGYPTERSEILAAIAASDPASVLIVGGDQHWPSVMELPLPGGGTVLELGCTPIAAFERPPPSVGLGPDALFVGTGRGFGELQLDAGGFRYAFVDEQGADRFVIERTI